MLPDYHGDPDAGNPMSILNPITLTEVQEVEIVETYKKLIGTATIRFPKGTIFRSTIIGTATLEGKDASRITTEVMQDGVVIEKRSSYSAMDATTFKTGQRVRIRLGYNGMLRTMFDGYITGYNTESSFELKCENMAYKLKLKQAPKFETPASGTSVNDVMEGKYNILKDTGFKLHSETKRFDIQIGKSNHGQLHRCRHPLGVEPLPHLLLSEIRRKQSRPDARHRYRPSVLLRQESAPVSGRQRIRSFLYPLRHACGLVGFESAQDRPEIPCRAGQGVGLG